MGKDGRVTPVEQSDGTAPTGEASRTVAVRLGEDREHREDVVQQVRRDPTVPAVVERPEPAENGLQEAKGDRAALRLPAPVIVRRVHVQNRIAHSDAGRTCCMAATPSARH